MIEISSYTDYRTYINDLIAAKPNAGRGIRSALALHLRCQTAYLSRVMSGQAELSLEQASRVNSFFNHTVEESHIFLLLVQLARSESKELKKYFSLQLNKAVSDELALKNRLQVKEALSDADRAKYYSSWQYVAVHMLVSIPSFQTKQAISDYLQIPMKRTTEIIRFLESVGLTKRTPTGLTVAIRKVHLPHDSPFISKHHTNWRLQAIQALDLPDENNLHYSSVITCAEKDMTKIKAILVKAIENVRELVAPSEDEGLCVYNVDFFRR